MINFEETINKIFSDFMPDEGWIVIIIIISIIVVKVTNFLSKVGLAGENLKMIFNTLLFWRTSNSKRKGVLNTFGKSEKIYVPNKGVLDELSELICEHPVVCVTGPSGVGKTTVVKQLGLSKNLKKFKKKYRVDLEDVNPPNVNKGESLEKSYDTAKNAFDRGFNLEREANYFDFANGILVPTLIFIDNYEQILDNDNLDVQIRENLIKPFSHNDLVHIVITSRIYISDTNRFELKELKNPNTTKGLTSDQLVNDFPAIKLFCKIHNDLRRKRKKSKILFTNSEFETIIELCNSVSNLPLGIRLIACRSFDKKFDEIKRELKETYKTEIPPQFLKKSDRHRTLFNAFIWSIKLLNKDERNFLYYLTHFKNGFFTKNIPIWPGHKKISQTIMLIEKLHLHSILKEEPYEYCSEPKYELYVFSKQVLELYMEENGITLRTEYLSSICTQYSKRLKQISEQIFNNTDKPINYLELTVEIRQDLENISYFTEWCTKNRKDLAVEILIDIERILNEIGPYLILEELYDPLLEHYKVGEKRAKLLISKARVLKSSEKRYLSLALVVEALEILEKSQVVNTTLGEAYRIGAWLCEQLGNYDLRTEIISKIEKLNSDQKNELGSTHLAFIDLEKAKQFEKQGKIQLAVGSFEKSMKLLEGHSIQQAKVANFIGIFYWRIGKPKVSEKHFISAIKKYKNLGENRWILGFKTNLGLLYADTGNFKDGFHVVKEAFEVLQQEGPYGWYLINLQSKGRLLSRMRKSKKRFKDAEKLLKDSCDKLKELKYYESLTLGEIELAELYYKYDKKQKALEKAKLGSAKCLEYKLTYTMRYFRSLVLEGILAREFGDLITAKEKYSIAKELLSNVDGNNWLTYDVCEKNWIKLNEIINDKK